MKNIVLLALLLFCFASKANELPNFKEIQHAITEGKKITFLINLGKCSSEKPLGDITISTTPNAFMMIGNERITTSKRHFTLDNPRAPNIPLFQYAKYTINSDGTVVIKLTLMKAFHYTKLNQSQIQCSLSEGFKAFAKN